MAKKSTTEKNEHRKALIAKFRNKRTSLKEKIHDKTTSMEERMELVMKLAKLPRNSSRVRARNRCNITGRPRGYDRKTGLCRIAFRELASRGLIPGVKKASW